MNWTVDDVKRYVQKRLREEERTRTKLYANHHPSEVSPTIAQPDSGKALVGSAPRKEAGGTSAPQRAQITYIVRARRPCDFDNWNIKFLQDCLVASGILDDDNWQVLSGRVISEKAHRKDEGVTVIIESL